MNETRSVQRLFASVNKVGVQTVRRRNGLLTEDKM